MKVDLHSDGNREGQIAVVDHVPEATQIERLTEDRHLMRIRIVVHEDFSCVKKSLHDRALSGAVGTKQKRDRFELNTYRVADGPEILDGESS